MYPIQDHRQSWSLSHIGKRWGTPMTGCQSTTERQRHGYRCECEQSQLYSQNRIAYYPNMHVFGLVKKVGALGGNPHMQRENVLTHKNASEPRIFLQWGTGSSLKHNFISNILCTMSYLLVDFYARWRISISVLCFSSSCWLDRGKSWPDLQVERGITMKTAMKENIKRVRGWRIFCDTRVSVWRTNYTKETGYTWKQWERQVNAKDRNLLEKFKMHHSLIMRELKIFPVNINVWVNTFH